MARGLKFRIKEVKGLYYVAKTKALISSVTVKLICVFVFAYAKSRFSHDKAHLELGHTKNCTNCSMCLYCYRISENLPIFPPDGLLLLNYRTILFISPICMCAKNTHLCFRVGRPTTFAQVSLVYICLSQIVSAL